MGKNLLLGLGEIGLGLLILPPSAEDVPSGGASVPLTGVLGAALVYDGLKRL